MSVARLTFVRSLESDMADRPDKKKRKRDEKEPKPTIFKTDDEIMDEIFSPEIRKKLKELADEKRPKNED